MTQMHALHTKPDNDLTICPACDVILGTPGQTILVGTRLICPRCHYVLRRCKKNTVRRTLALSLTGLILYIPAHFKILLTFGMLGLTDQGSVFESVKSLFQQEYGFVSLVVLLTALLFPLLKLGLLFLLSLGISQRIYAALLPVLLRWYQHLEEWGMSEIYLIAVLVTVIKMEHTTHIIYETGLLCFVGLVVVMSCIAAVFDRHAFWQKIEELAGERFAGPDQQLMVPRLDSPGTKNRGKGISAGFMQCHTCRKVVRPRQPEKVEKVTCPRCGSTIHWRKRRAASRTLALILAAAFLSFPANILPIMTVSVFGITEKSTIMDGITYFFQSGAYGIGLIILTASILVPLFKILGLGVLLYSIRFRRATRLLHKAFTFRFISFIGRWSMLDIFVIALLCSLVNFGFFTRVEAAPAAVFFASVVLSTMFAAITFDERLLWDVADLEGR